MPLPKIVRSSPFPCFDTACSCKFLNKLTFIGRSMIGETTGQKQVESERERPREKERSARDVTKHERAERELRERVEEIEAMMEAMPAVVLIAHDPDCRVISGNRVAQESLRMPKGSNISKSAPDGQKPTHFKVLSGGVE